MLEMTCIPCSSDIPPLDKEKSTEFLKKLQKEWEIDDFGHLRRYYNFQNFQEAMEFANEVAKISEQEGHHPDLKIGWGYCTIEIWTHKINGLSDSDFFLAAKLDNLGCKTS